jgi:hypothetical protein
MHILTFNEAFAGANSRGLLWLRTGGGRGGEVVRDKG